MREIARIGLDVFREIPDEAEHGLESPRGTWPLQGADARCVFAHHPAMLPHPTHRETLRHGGWCRVSGAAKRSLFCTLATRMPWRRMQQWGEDVSFRGEGDKFASMDMGSHGAEARECIAHLFSGLQYIAQSQRQTACASDSKR